MDPHRSTPGQDTTASLQRAADAGVPVMIPGAREQRGARRSNPLAGTEVTSAARGAGAGASDPARLARAREGGGAASERFGARRSGMMSLIGGWIGHGLNLLRPPPAPPSSGDNAPLDRSS